MKFYCYNCESNFNTGDKVDVALWQDCPFCSTGRLGNMIVPDYETPEQYEKRMGKQYPKDGAVWRSFGYGDRWILDTLEGALAEYAHHCNCIVIADPSVPPPRLGGISEC